MLDTVLSGLRRSDEYYEEIHPNVWLMDCHKWAFYIWELYRSRNSGKIPSTLVHIDYHWDGVNDYQDDKDVLDLIGINSNEQVRDIVAADSLVRIDSFIAPAIIRGFVKEVHFLCLQKDTEIGIDEDLLQAYCAKQFVYDDIDMLSEQVAGQPIIFDMDLDIFNKSELDFVGDIWKADDIARFIGRCANMLASSSLVTIAASFDYLGGDDDAINLAKLVMPAIIEKCKTKS